MKRTARLCTSALLLLSLILCVFVGCRSKPLDLTGEWYEEDAEWDTVDIGIRSATGDVVYQEFGRKIEISDNTIKIYHIVNGASTLWWVGTYDAPLENVDEYSWKSVALIEAKNFPEIEFKYSNGRLSYKEKWPTNNTVVFICG